MANPADLLAQYLEAIGFTGPDLEGTPRRVTELLDSFRPAPLPTMSTFDAGGSGPIVVRRIPYYALCAHHLVPFFGHADVAYQPSATIAGLGSIASTVTVLARRPQLQERLTEQIADALVDALQPRGVVVRLQARQMCLELRSAADGTLVETEAHRGTIGSLLAMLNQ